RVERRDDVLEAERDRILDRQRRMQRVRGMVAHLARPDLVGLLAAGHAHAAADHIDRLLLRMLVRTRAVAGAPVHLHHLDRPAAHDWTAGVGMRRGDEVIEVAVEEHAGHEVPTRIWLRVEEVALLRAPPCAGAAAASRCWCGRAPAGTAPR